MLVKWCRCKLTAQNDVSISEKKTSDHKYVSFVVKKEPWNKYKLEDKSILKTKFILINVTMTKSLDEVSEEWEKNKKPVEIGMGIQSTTVVGVEVPTELRGTPTPIIEELRSSIIEEDLDFETLNGEYWNEYQLENRIKLKVKNTLINVAKSSKFDSMGAPIYLVDGSVSIKASLPKSTKGKFVLKKA